MSTRVLILGAGFGGLELATRLSESHADEVQVTLIDRSDAFSFGFSKLAVMFGERSLEQVRLPYDRISKPSVEFRREAVTAVDPEARRVETDGGAYEADILVIAMGASYDVDATPGFREHGLEYYSVEGADRMRGAIEAFESGGIVISILSQPFKCPPAPFEAAMLLHDHFEGRGIRDQVEIQVLGPMAAPVPITSQVSAAFLEALSERGVPYVPRQRVVSVSGDGLAVTDDGTEYPFDMFIGIPVHRAPRALAESGLLDESGWIPVDKQNLRTSFPGVYALGDVAGTPNPKAGVFAEAAAISVAEDIAAQMGGGGELAHPFKGQGHCYLEFGGGRVAKVEVDFFGGPKPTASLVGPSQDYAADKREFEATRIERWFGPEGP